MYSASEFNKKKLHARSILSNTINLTLNNIIKQANKNDDHNPCNKVIKYKRTQILQWHI